MSTNRAMDFCSEVRIALRRFDAGGFGFEECVSHVALAVACARQPPTAAAADAWPDEAEEKAPSGHNRPPTGEPACPEDWNAGYEAGFTDGKLAAQVELTDERVNALIDEWAEAGGYAWLAGATDSGVSQADLAQLVHAAAALATQQQPEVRNG